MVECLLSLYQIWIRFIHTVIDWVFGCVQVLVDDRPARWSGEWSGTVLNRGEFALSRLLVADSSLDDPFRFLITSFSLLQHLVRFLIFFQDGISFLSHSFSFDSLSRSVRLKFSLDVQIRFN